MDQGAEETIRFAAKSQINPNYRLHVVFQSAMPMGHVGAWVMRMVCGSLWDVYEDKEMFQTTSCQNAATTHLVAGPCADCRDCRASEPYHVLEDIVLRRRSQMPQALLSLQGISLQGIHTKAHLRAYLV